MQHEIKVTPSEIRVAWSEIQRGAVPFTLQGESATVARIPQYRGSKRNAWIGASGAQIQDRLDHGYDVEEKDLDVGGEAAYSVPAVWLDEESGDLLIDQVLGGEDLYRAQWAESETPRSLTIRACIGMNAGAEADVIAAYNEWLLKVIDAAIRKGITPSVELWIGTSGGFIGSRDELMIRIPLVNEGEMVDVTSWRAYFAPGAFRSLGFVALALGADKAKRRLNIGMGRPTNSSWSVTFNDDVLNIECPVSAQSFPEDLMDRALKDAYGE